MDRSNHPHAKIVEGLHQRQIARYGRAVLHAHEDKALLAGQDAGGVIRLQRQFELRVVARDHFPDLRSPNQSVIPGCGVACRSARALGCKDDKEAAVDTPLNHPRKVDLAIVQKGVVPVQYAPARPGEVGGGVEMGVEHHRRFVRLPWIWRGGLPGCGEDEKK